MALTTYDEDALFSARREAIAANGARTGRSLHRIASKGAGEVHIVQPIDFRLTFVEQPTFTNGLSLLNGQLVSGAYPIASVGVYKWRRDTRGFYTGAYLWVGVTSAPTDLVPLPPGDYDAEIVAVQRSQAEARALNSLSLEHHLCFEGMAIRDVDFDQIMADG